MERQLFVGDKVQLTVEMFGLQPGAVGVVYEEYDLGEGPGASIIFENGDYDGFATWEQEDYVEKVGHEPLCADYAFTNVMRLQQDFRRGVFNPVFSQ